MTDVIKIFSQIQSTSKKTEKEKLIKTNQDNKLFLECLKFLLDGKVLTGISKKKLDKKLKVKISGVSPINSLDKKTEWESCMDYLKANNTGTDTDIYWMQMFLNRQSEEHKEFYYGMITKSLKLGCDYKTVNKALGYNLIDVWEVQQAYSIDKYPLKPNTFFCLSEKQNGNHGSFSRGKLISRQGLEFTGLQHIINDIQALGDTLNQYFFDGELKRKNIDGLADSDNFQLGTGIINSDAPTKEQIEFIIYDMMPVEEFEAGESKLTFKDRKKQLEELRQLISTLGLKNISVIEYFYEGTDQDEIQKWLDVMNTNDKEGLMVNKDTTYKCKRNNGILKVKSFYTMDLTIVDIVEGDGKYKGTLGAVIVDYKGNNVGVGTGFTDNERHKLWENKDEYIGRICEVKYKGVTRDKKTKLESLQFPTYVQIREIGKEVSYY